MVKLDDVCNIMTTLRMLCHNFNSSTCDKNQFKSATVWHDVDLKQWSRVVCMLASDSEHLNDCFGFVYIGLSSTLGLLVVPYESNMSAGMLFHSVLPTAQTHTHPPCTLTGPADYVLLLGILQPIIDHHNNHNKRGIFLPRLKNIIRKKTYRAFFQAYYLKVIIRLVKGGLITITLLLILQILPCGVVLKTCHPNSHSQSRWWPFNSLIYSWIFYEIYN